MKGLHRVPSEWPLAFQAAQGPLTSALPGLQATAWCKWSPVPPSRAPSGVLTPQLHLPQGPGHSPEWVETKMKGGGGPHYPGGLGEGELSLLAWCPGTEGGHRSWRDSVVGGVPAPLCQAGSVQGVCPAPPIPRALQGSRFLFNRDMGESLLHMQSWGA